MIDPCAAVLPKEKSIPRTRDMEIDVLGGRNETNRE
jgi:hypothetical protein